MNMDAGSTNTSVMSMMVPWLHTEGGDSLLFKSWHPTSPGAIAGASIALVAIALLERWLSASRGLLEVYWKKRALTMLAGDISSERSSSDCHKGAPAEQAPDSNRPGSGSLSQSKATRRIPPFIASHDLLRGLMHALQALLAYVLMLSVMTFQVAYLVSIVVGLGIGEVIFGRIGGAQAHFGH